MSSSHASAHAPHADSAEDEGSAHHSERHASVSTSTGSSLSSSTEDVFSQTVSLDPPRALEDELVAGNAKPSSSSVPQPQPHAVASLTTSEVLQQSRHARESAHKRSTHLTSPLSADKPGPPLVGSSSPENGGIPATRADAPQALRFAISTMPREEDERVPGARPPTVLSNTSFGRSLGSFQRAPMSASSFMTDSVSTSRLAASRVDNNATDNDSVLPAELEDEAYIQRFHIHTIISLLAHDLLEIKPHDPILFTRNWLLQKLVEEEVVVSTRHSRRHGHSAGHSLRRHGSTSPKRTGRHSGHRPADVSSQARKPSQSGGHMSAAHCGSEQSHDGRTSAGDPTTHEEDEETSVATMRQSFSLKTPEDDASVSVGASEQRRSHNAQHTNRGEVASDGSSDDDDDDSEEEWSNVKLLAHKSPTTSAYTSAGPSSSSRRKASDSTDKSGRGSRHRRHKKNQRDRRRRHRSTSSHIKETSRASSSDTSLNSDSKAAAASLAGRGEDEDGDGAEGAHSQLSHSRKALETPPGAADIRSGSRRKQRDLPLPVHSLHRHRTAGKHEASTPRTTVPASSCSSAEADSRNPGSSSGGVVRVFKDADAKSGGDKAHDEESESHDGWPLGANSTEVFAFHHAAAASGNSAAGASATSYGSLTPEPLMATKRPESSDSGDFADVQKKEDRDGVDDSPPPPDRAVTELPPTPSKPDASTHTTVDATKGTHLDVEDEAEEEGISEFCMAQFAPVISLDPPPATATPPAPTSSASTFGVANGSGASSHGTSASARLAAGYPSSSVDIRSVHTNPPHSEIGSPSPATRTQSAPSMGSATARELSNIPSAILASVAPTMASNVRLSHHSQQTLSSVSVPSFALGTGLQGVTPKPHSMCVQSPTSHTDTEGRLSPGAASHADPHARVSGSDPPASAQDAADGPLFNVVPSPRTDGGGMGVGLGSSPSRNASFFSVPNAYGTSGASRVLLSGFASGSSGSQVNTGATPASVAHPLAHTPDVLGPAPVLSASVPVLSDILPSTTAATITVGALGGARHESVLTRQYAQSAGAVSPPAPSLSGPSPAAVVRVRDAPKHGEVGSEHTRLTASPPSSASVIASAASAEAPLCEWSPTMASFPILNTGSATASVTQLPARSHGGSGGHVNPSAGAAASMPLTGPTHALGELSTSAAVFTHLAGAPPSPQPLSMTSQSLLQYPQQHARMEALVSRLPPSKCSAAIAFLEGLLDSTHDSELADLMNDPADSTPRVAVQAPTTVASSASAVAPIKLGSLNVTMTSLRDPATTPPAASTVVEDDRTDMRRAQSASLTVDALKASKSESVRAIVDDVLSHSVLMRLPHSSSSLDRNLPVSVSNTYMRSTPVMALAHASDASTVEDLRALVSSTAHALDSAATHPAATEADVITVAAATAHVPTDASPALFSLRDTVDAESGEATDKPLAQSDRGRTHDEVEGAATPGMTKAEAGKMCTTEERVSSLVETIAEVYEGLQRTEREVSQKMTERIRHFNSDGDDGDGADKEGKTDHVEAEAVEQEQRRARDVQRRASGGDDSSVKEHSQYLLPREPTSEGFELGEMTLRHAIIDFDSFRESQEASPVHHTVDYPLSLGDDDRNGCAEATTRSNLITVGTVAASSDPSLCTVSQMTTGDQSVSPAHHVPAHVALPPAPGSGDPVEVPLIKPMTPTPDEENGGEDDSGGGNVLSHGNEARSREQDGGGEKCTEGKLVSNACASSALPATPETDAEDPLSTPAAGQSEPSECIAPSREELTFVENALAHYDVFAILDESQTAGLAHVMARRELQKGDVIVREGEPALNLLLLVLHGTITIAFRGVVRRTVGRGGFYGEVEVSYSLERSRTTLTVTSPNAVIFTLPKAMYREAIVAGRAGSREMFLPAVNSSPLLQKLPQDVKERLAGALQPCTLRAGTILQQSHAPVEWMYIVLSGTVEGTAPIPAGATVPATESVTAALGAVTHIKCITRGPSPGHELTSPTDQRGATERTVCTPQHGGEDTTTKVSGAAEAAPKTLASLGAHKRGHRVQRGAKDDSTPPAAEPNAVVNAGGTCEADATGAFAPQERTVSPMDGAGSAADGHSKGNTNNSDELITVVMSTGALVGEVEFIFKCRGIFTVRAVTAVRTARVSRLHFEVLTSRATLNSLKYHLAMSPSYQYFESRASEEAKTELRRLLSRGRLLSRAASVQGGVNCVGSGGGGSGGGGRQAKERHGRGAAHAGPGQSSVDDVLGSATRTANTSYGRSQSMLIVANSDLAQGKHRRSLLSRVITDSLVRTHNNSFASTASQMDASFFARAGGATTGTYKHSSRRHHHQTDGGRSSRLFLHHRVDAAGEVVFAGRKKMYRFPMVAFSTSGNILISVVADGTIIRWNNVAETVTGVPLFDAVGTSIFDLIASHSARGRLQNALDQAKTYAGRIPEYVAAGLDKQHVLPFRQRAGIYSVGLALSVVPSISTDTAEVLLLVGREAKQRPASSYAADVAKWLEGSMRPQLQSFLLSVREVETRATPVTAQDVSHIRGHVEACLALTEQFRHFSTLNMDHVHDNWHAVRVPILMRRFIIDMTELATQNGGSFFCNLDEVEPKTDIFMNVEQIGAILRMLVSDAYAHPREVVECATTTTSVMTGGDGDEAVASGHHAAADADDGQGADTAPIPAASPTRRRLPVAVEFSVRAVEPMAAHFGLLSGVPGNRGEIPSWSPSSIATAPAAVGHQSSGPITVSGLSGGANNNSFDAASANGSVGGRNGSNTVDLSPSSLRRIRFEIRDTGATIPFFHRGLDIADGAETTDPLECSPLATDSTKASFTQCPKLRGAALAEVQKSVAEMGGKLYGFTRPDVDDNCIRLELPLLEVPGSAGEPGENGSPNATSEDGTGVWQNDGNSGELGRTYTVVVATNNQAQQNRLCQILWARQHAVVPVTSFKELIRKVSTEDKSDIPDIVMVDPLLLDFSPSDYDAVQGTDPIDEARDATAHVVLVVISNDFSDWRVQKLLDRNAVVELPYYSSGALVHIAMQEAERMVVEMRAEVERIEVLRQAFKNASEGRHRILRLIGKGTFGEVFEVEDMLTSGHMAMKRLQLRSDASADEVVQEILAVTSLQHENIIHYFFCEKESNTVLRLFMELATGGTLQNKIREQAGVGLPLGELVQHLTDVCRGLAYIHSQHYVHCDLKTANLLLGSRGRTKIGDFGTAKHLAPGQLLYALAGTAQYMAPEVLQADETAGVGYDYKADIWSLGCIVLEMATGHPPFAHLECARGVGIMKYLVELTDTPDLSPLFSGNPLVYDFVKSCLELDPNNRPSAQDLLRHEMLQGNVTSARAERIVKRAEMLYKLNKYAAVRDTAGEYPAGLANDSGSDFSTSYQSDSNATEDYNGCGLGGNSEYGTPEDDEGAFFFSCSFSSEYDDDEYDCEYSTEDEVEEDSDADRQAHDQMHGSQDVRHSTSATAAAAPPALSSGAGEEPHPAMQEGHGRERSH